MIPAVSAATGGVGAALPYLWVAATSGGLLYTSTSTTLSSAWTSRTSSFGTTAIYAVASNGTNQYVAVGDTGKLATSPDATTWTQRTSSFGTTLIRNVAYGAGYWVAVGDSAKVAYSTDGVTWTQVTTGITGTVLSVQWGNGLWVIGSSSGAIYTATNPTGTWTSRTSTLGSVNGVFYYPPQSIWVAGTDTGTTTGALASSTDGLTWTARNIPNALASASIYFASNSSVLVAGVVPGALTIDVITSTNGTTWTDRTPAIVAGTLIASASDNLGLMALQGGGLQSSSDGTTWTSRTSADPNTTCLCHSSGVPSIR